MVLKAIISDLDGVIVNTVPTHFKAWQKMFAEYGVAFTFEDYKRKVDGIPRMDGARAILTSLSDAELDEAARRKQGYFLEEIRHGVETYPTTIALFENLRAAGVELAAISASRNCEQILRSVGVYEMFAAVVTGNDIARGKPDPQVFQMAAERLGLEPPECVVFEDAILGVEAAKRGGFPCVGIDRHSAPENLAKADLVVSDLAEVDLEKLRALAGG